MAKAKKAASGSSRRAGLAEYEDQGLQRAIKYLGLQGIRLGTLSKEAVRQELDKLGPTAMLQVTVADFWLGLAKKEAQDRRARQPPTNPFKENGISSLAAKALIEQWELEWRMVEASKPLAISRIAKVRHVGYQMRSRFAWFVQDGDVVGLAEQPPTACFAEALVRPEDLAVRHLTLVDALRMPWKDTGEQIFWTERLQHGHRAVEAEVESLALKAQTRAKTD